MTFDATIVRVMIASPSDVPAARDAVERALHDWNQSHAESRKIVLLPWRWETSAVPGLGDTAQNLINAQGVDKSDILIGLFGSKLGSPTPTAASGTAEELERALLQGKPVHLYFSTEPIPRGTPGEQIIGLQEFQERISKLGLLGSFDDLAELEREVGRAVTADMDALTIHNPSRYFDNGTTDRVYDVVEIEWRMSRSKTDPSVLDGTTRNSRSMISRALNGVELLTMSMSREAQGYLDFGSNGEVEFELASASRTGTGSMELLEARKSSASQFAQDVRFSPPLQDGERAEVVLAGTVPGFKYAYREDVIAYSQRTKMGIRDWEFISRTISHPISQFIYSLFLPDDVDAVPLGPRVGLSGVDQAMTAEVTHDSYSQTRTTIDGVEGWLMKLDVRYPRLNYVYRLAWRPPAQKKS